jgi:hypothetical protein
MESNPQSPTIAEFLRVIWVDWGSRVSGALSVPFTALAVYVKADYAEAIWSALAVVGWFATFFQVWAKERKERILAVLPRLKLCGSPAKVHTILSIRFPIPAAHGASKFVYASLTVGITKWLNHPCDSRASYS